MTMLNSSIESSQQDSQLAYCLSKKKSFWYQQWYILLILIIVAFAIRWLSWEVEGKMARDSVMYVRVVEQWSQGGDLTIVLKNWDSFWIPPLFLYLVKELTHWGISPNQAAIIINITAGIVLVPVFFWLGNILFEDKRIPIAAALVIAVHPTAIEYSTIFLRESTYLLWCGIALAAWLQGISNSRLYWWGITGAFAALAILTRYEGLELVVLGILSCCIDVVWCRDRLRLNLLRAGLLVLACLIVFWLLNWLMGTADMVLPMYWKYLKSRFGSF